MEWSAGGSEAVDVVKENPALLAQTCGGSSSFEDPSLGGSSEVEKINSVLDESDFLQIVCKNIHLLLFGDFLVGFEMNKFPSL